MKNLLVSLVRFLDSLSDNPRLIAFILLLLGISISLSSYWFGLHEVTWNGKVPGLTITGVPEGFEKQVGFMYAPNWALSAVLIIPISVFFILKAKNEVKYVIEDLISSDMIIKTDGSDLNIDFLYKEWNRKSFSWFLISLSFVFISTAFVIFGDFFPVVLQWLIHAENIQELTKDIGEKIPLNDSTYEFDWSIAATFEGNSDLKWRNIILSSSAYLLVPTIGTGIILLHMIWFLALADFISPENLRKKNIIILPKLDSRDSNDRAGFEKFETLFDDLLLACISTSLIALLMHLQNIFLRAPNYNNIIDMIFTENIKNLVEIFIGSEGFKLENLIRYLSPVNEALSIDWSAITIQTYIASFGIGLLSLIVLFSVWMSLRQTAIKGKKYLLEREELPVEHEKSLNRMNIWPVGWISINGAMFFLIAIFLSMFVLSLLPFILVYYSLLATRKFVFWGRQ